MKIRSSFIVEKLMHSLKMEAIVRTHHRDESATVEAATRSRDSVETIMTNTKDEVITIVSYEFYAIEKNSNASLRLHNMKLRNPKEFVAIVKAMRKLFKFEPEVNDQEKAD